MVVVCLGALSHSPCVFCAGAVRRAMHGRYMVVSWADGRELSSGDGDRGCSLAPVHCGGRGEVLEEFGKGVSFINLLLLCYAYLSAQIRQV